MHVELERTQAPIACMHENSGRISFDLINMVKFSTI